MDLRGCMSFKLTAKAAITPKSNEVVMPVSFVHAFTDRPYRDTAQLPPEALEALWGEGGDNSFVVDPPNAALTYQDTTQVPASRSIVCELVAAPTHDEVSSQLSFTLRVLDPLGEKLPSSLSNASLFIDSGAGPCPTADDTEAVEWFNMENFNGNYGVSTSRMDNGYVFASVMCDEEPMTPDFLDLRVFQPETPDVYMGCKTGESKPLSLDTTKCANFTCPLVFAAVNTESGVVYSETNVTAPPYKADTVYNLQAATLPSCGSS